MNAQQALKIVNQNLAVAIHDSDGANAEYEQEQINALELAAFALEEQIPKKPNKGIPLGDKYSIALFCPSCERQIINVWNIDKYEPNYCHYCGQKLDWSDTE